MEHFWIFSAYIFNLIWSKVSVLDNDWRGCFCDECFCDECYLFFWVAEIENFLSEAFWIKMCHHTHVCQGGLTSWSWSILRYWNRTTKQVTFRQSELNPCVHQSYVKYIDHFVDFLFQSHYRIIGVFTLAGQCQTFWRPRWNFDALVPKSTWRQMESVKLLVQTDHKFLTRASHFLSLHHQCENP